MNRKAQAAVVLSILFISALVWSYYRWPRQESVDNLKFLQGQKVPPSRAKTAAASPLPSASGELALRLDLLEKEKEKDKGSRRNLFKPVFINEAKLIKHKPPVKPVTAPPQEPPKRELPKFTLKGFVTEDDKQTVFLGLGKEILLVKEGDVFQGLYRAKSITDKAVTIQLTDTGEEVIVPISENRSLAGMVKQ